MPKFFRVALRVCAVCMGLLVYTSNFADEVSGLSESKLVAIQDGFEQRVTAIFNAEHGHPLLKHAIMDPTGPGRVEYSREYAFSLVSFAARCLWLDESNQAANQALQETADYYLANPARIYDDDNFHWHSDAQLRLIELFGTHGTRKPGLIQSETERKILESVWLYSKRRDAEATKDTHIAEADQAISKTWFIMGSENHHAQSFTTLWHFAKIARSRADFCNRLYDDGQTVAAHYASWTDYAKLYLLERARKGMFIEMMSVEYNTVLLKGLFNLYDFSEDPELKRRTKLFLDLYFTYWGEEQIKGVAGGGKARIYTDFSSQPSWLGYLFFGLGKSPGLRCELITAMTTSYRPSLLVVDIVSDLSGRGNYEVSQRPLGLAADHTHYTPPVYRLRTDYGGILRYSYCTPDFVIGTVMCEARPESDWTMISSQNRRQGAIFTGHPEAAILPECMAIRDSRAYNAEWSVQRKGTLICQKLKTNKNAGKMRVWFSKNGLSAPVEQNGWVFTESTGAYGAVRVVQGGTHWADEDGKIKGRWLYGDDEFSPVILEVVQKKDYATSADFRSAVVNRSVKVVNGVLKFKGLYGDDFKFFSDYSKVPEINGTPVNYAPEKAFDSPWIQSVWNSGLVILSKGMRREVLDFNTGGASDPSESNSDVSLPKK